MATPILLRPVRVTEGTCDSEYRWICVFSPSRRIEGLKLLSSRTISRALIRATSRLLGGVGDAVGTFGCFVTATIATTKPNSRAPAVTQETCSHLSSLATLSFSSADSMLSLYFE